MKRFARTYHKWLMAFIGVQFLIWSITGLYMVSMDIHFIHGETLEQPATQSLQLTEATYSINQLRQDYAGASAIRLTRAQGRQVYQFNILGQAQLPVDAATGESLPTVDELTARQIAQRAYVNEHEIASAHLLTTPADLPTEVSPRYLPVWQIQFAHFADPTFYISQTTGEIVTKRHDYWRIFDWFWRFHIMDYDDGENVGNWFLLLIALLGSMAAITGAVLTYQRVISSKNRRRAG